MRGNDIVFATDFSDPAEHAAVVAREYARRFGARLHVFHVLSHGEYDVTPMLRAQADFAAPVPVTIASAIGDPAAEIVRYARRVGAGLIVLGTHGRTGVSRALLGSVAERVTRTAPCPVLAVPMTGPSVTTSTPATAAPEAPAASRCAVCGMSSADLICAKCRAMIRGEALERKLHDERAGRTPGERARR